MRSLPPARQPPGVTALRALQHQNGLPQSWWSSLILRLSISMTDFGRRFHIKSCLCSLWGEFFHKYSGLPLIGSLWDRKFWVNYAAESNKGSEHLYSYMYVSVSPKVELINRLTQLFVSQLTGVHCTCFMDSILKNLYWVITRVTEIWRLIFFLHESMVVKKN